MELRSPIKDMPECWKDEKRMNSLYAPFRKKELNPVDWESKMKFWQTVIKKWCFENNCSSLTAQAVEKAFKRGEKTPNCIMTVIEELTRNGEVKCTSEFLAINPTQSWTSWAFDSVVKTPFSWGVSKVRSMLTSPVSPLQPDTSFVLISFLKERGNVFLSSALSSEKKLFTIKDIVKILSSDSSSPISDESVEHIIHFLQLQKLVLMDIVGETKIVKPLRPGDPKSHEITKAEMAIFKLQQNKTVLRENVSHLEREMLKCTSEAKRHLSAGMKLSATMQLKKRKRISLCMNSRLNALDNLSSLIARIRSAESDSMVLEAYKSGLAAFKDIFSKSGLSEDDVFDTMAKLQDMNDYQGEIEMAMSQPLEKEFDDEELEEELNDLLKNVEPDSPEGDQVEQVESGEEDEEMESTEELDDTLPIPKALLEQGNPGVLSQVPRSYEIGKADERTEGDPHVNAMISMARNFCQQLKDDYDQKLPIPSQLKDNSSVNLPSPTQSKDIYNRNLPTQQRDLYDKNSPVLTQAKDNTNQNIVVFDFNETPTTSSDFSAIESLDNDFKHILNLPPVPSNNPMELIYDAQRRKMVEELDRAVKLKKILEAHPPV